MATPILMPRQGQSVESCVLVEWRIAPGETVKAGAPVASIETDKAVFEVESPGDGTVLALLCQPGDDVPVLTPIAVIGQPGENIAEWQSSPAGRDAAASDVTATSPALPADTPAVPQPSATQTHTAATGAPGVSPRAKGLATPAGLDPATLTGSGPQGRVIARDVEAALAVAPRLTPAARAAAVGGKAIPATGSGPGGMVRAGDLTAVPSPTSAATAESATPGPVTVDTAPEVIPLTGIRKRIADRMRQSLNVSAQLTLTRTVEATALLEYRRQVKSEGERLGLPNITLNDMLVFAVARTLKRHPALNAHVADSRILRFSDVHVGVATDTPRGLMVPVLRHADRYNLPALSRALKPLLEAAQSGAISPDALRGGTFTITNLGMLGVEAFTPILNTPEAAILGVGGLVLKPVQRDQGVIHVQAMTLSLTIDHQVVDGAPAARFLADLATAIEHFALTLTERG